MIRRTSKDAPKFKQTIKVQREVIEVEEETTLRTFAVDVMWGDTPILKKFQNKGDRDAQSKVFKAWFRRMGGQEIWEFTGDSCNWEQEPLKGEKILYIGQFKVNKKVALRVVSVSGRVDLTTGAVFYIMPGHWINQCGIPPLSLNGTKGGAGPGHDMLMI